VSSPTPGAYERVQFIDEALEDMRTLASRSPVVLREVLAQLKRLDNGSLRPEPLNDFSKTGDLTDCGKIVIALDGEPEYRVVVRDLEGAFHVVEVVSVEARAQDLPYLLAGLRLGRIHDPVRRSDTLRRVFRIRRMLGGGD
jgi:hypothetical protein